jgi:hypothetical protein
VGGARAAETALGTVGLALTVILGAIAVITTVAAAVVVARSKTVQQNLELLRGAVADLTTETTRLTAERDACKEQLEAQPNMSEVLAELREMKRGRAFPSGPA